MYFFGSGDVVTEESSSKKAKSATVLRSSCVRDHYDISHNMRLHSGKHAPTTGGSCFITTALTVPCRLAFLLTFATTLLAAFCNAESPLKLTIKVGGTIGNSNVGTCYKPAQTVDILVGLSAAGFTSGSLETSFPVHSATFSAVSHTVNAPCLKPTEFALSVDFGSTGRPDFWGKNISSTQFALHLAVAPSGYTSAVGSPIPVWTRVAEVVSLGGLLTSRSSIIIREILDIGMCREDNCILSSFNSQPLQPQPSENEHMFVPFEVTVLEAPKEQVASVSDFVSLFLYDPIFGDAAYEIELKLPVVSMQACASNTGSSIVDTCYPSLVTAGFQFPLFWTQMYSRCSMQLNMGGNKFRIPSSSNVCMSMSPITEDGAPIVKINASWPPMSIPTNESYFRWNSDPLTDEFISKYQSLIFFKSVAAESIQNQNTATNVPTTVTTILANVISQGLQLSQKTSYTYYIGTYSPFTQNVIYSSAFEVPVLLSANSAITYNSLSMPGSVELSKYLHQVIISIQVTFLQDLLAMKKEEWGYSLGYRTGPRNAAGALNAPNDVMMYNGTGSDFLGRTSDGKCEFLLPSCKEGENSVFFTLWSAGYTHGIFDLTSPILCPGQAISQFTLDCSPFGYYSNTQRASRGNEFCIPCNVSTHFENPNVSTNAYENRCRLFSECAGDLEPFGGSDTALICKPGGQKPPGLVQTSTTSTSRGDLIKTTTSSVTDTASVDVNSLSSGVVIAGQATTPADILAAQDQDSSGDSAQTAIIAGAAAGGAVALILLVACIVYATRRKSPARRAKAKLDGPGHSGDTIMMQNNPHYQGGETLSPQSSNDGNNKIPMQQYYSSPTDNSGISGYDYAVPTGSRSSSHSSSYSSPTVLVQYDHLDSRKSSVSKSSASESVDYDRLDTTQASLPEYNRLDKQQPSGIYANQGNSSSATATATAAHTSPAYDRLHATAAPNTQYDHVDQHATAGTQQEVYSRLDHGEQKGFEAVEYAEPIEYALPTEIHRGDAALKASNTLKISYELADGAKLYSGSRDSSSEL